MGTIVLFPKVTEVILSVLLKEITFMGTTLLFPKVTEVIIRVMLTEITYRDTTRGVFRPRQTRQLPRAVDLKGRLLSCQSY